MKKLLIVALFATLSIVNQASALSFVETNLTSHALCDKCGGPHKPEKEKDRF